VTSGLFGDDNPGQILKETISGRGETWDRVKSGTAGNQIQISYVIKSTSAKQDVEK